MESGKCPCDQHTDKASLPEDEDIICVYWDTDNNRCNLSYMKNKVAK